MSAPLPLVLTQELAEAERALWAAGAEAIEVQVTAPPRRTPPTGPRRVVRQRAVGRRVQLVVAASIQLGAEGSRR